MPNSKPSEWFAVFVRSLMGPVVWILGRMRPRTTEPRARVVRVKHTNEGVPDRSSMDGTPADYTLACVLCGAETVRIGRRKLGLIISSPIRSYGVAVDNVAETIQAIEENQLGRLHELLSESGFDGLDFYCPECDELYCEKHYQMVPEWDAGFYDCTFATCPQGHQRIIDD